MTFGLWTDERCSLGDERKTVDNCFSRRKSTKQGVGRAECIEAIDEDYATGRGYVRTSHFHYLFKSHLRNQKNSVYPFGWTEFFLFGRGCGSVLHDLLGYEREVALRPKGE